MRTEGGKGAGQETDEGKQQKNVGEIGGGHGLRGDGRGEGRVTGSRSTHNRLRATQVCKYRGRCRTRGATPRDRPPRLPSGHKRLCLYPPPPGHPRAGHIPRAHAPCWHASEPTSPARPANTLPRACPASRPAPGPTHPVVLTHMARPHPLSSLFPSSFSTLLDPPQLPSSVLLDPPPPS